MRVSAGAFVEESLPLWDPVIATEKTDDGWRGLTSQGEVLEVTAGNGHPINIPSELIVAHRGQSIARREVHDVSINISAYLEHFNRVVAMYRTGQLDQALFESDLALAIAKTLRAKFNRAMVLLAIGRWEEGFSEYIDCEQYLPFTRPQVIKALQHGLTPWRGEDLNGKHLLLLHSHGFGDTIQMLRYVPQLRVMGAKVTLIMPDELEDLAFQMSDVEDDFIEADYFCPILHLLHWLKVKPDQVDGSPYLYAPSYVVDKWRSHVGKKRKVGVVWSIGKPSDGDYPREIDIVQLVRRIGGDAEIHSLQIQKSDEASVLGIKSHHFGDFLECAGLMSLMDEIICVDTAALHLAGAIGHPNVRGLLSSWHSWRWQANWYNNVKLEIF